jgi:hypothetical protein
MIRKFRKIIKYNKNINKKNKNNSAGFEPPISHHESMWPEKAILGVSTY